MKATREAAIEAGLKLLNQVGLEGLTLRAIAAELGVKAPSLYWHFKSKQDLVDDMASAVLADVAGELAAPTPPDWREGGIRFGVCLRRALLRYRDGARMVGGSHLNNGCLHAPMERILEAFASAGIAASDAAQCLGTLHAYTIGYVLEEQAVLSPSGERDPRYALDERERRIDAGRFPLTRSIGADLFDHYDARFERGLKMIMTGFVAGTSLAESDRQP